MCRIFFIMLDNLSLPHGMYNLQCNCRAKPHYSLVEISCSARASVKAMQCIAVTLSSSIGIMHGSFGEHIT